MKRESVSKYVHMRRDTPLPLYAPVHNFDGPLHSPSYVHTNEWPNSQLKDK